MNRGNSFAVKINEALRPLNERGCTYRNVNIEKLRNLNLKYRHKIFRTFWQRKSLEEGGGRERSFV